MHHSLKLFSVFEASLISTHKTKLLSFLKYLEKNEKYMLDTGFVYYPIDTCHALSVVFDLAGGSRVELASLWEPTARYL